MVCFTSSHSSRYAGVIELTLPIVIDTDTAQDDCVAILLGYLEPAADLLGITLVAGNLTFGQQLHNAVLTLELGGGLGEVPIYVGCRRPMVKPLVSAVSVHGDGVGGIRFLGDASNYVSNEHAVDALIRLAREHVGNLRIVCIGPLTNIGLATIKDPDFVSNVAQLIIMGGSNNSRGNITPAAEFNFYVDPEAAKVVLTAGFRMTIVPWTPLTLADGVFRENELNTLEALDTPLSTFFGRLIQDTLAFDRSVGINGSAHPDSLAISCVLHPEIILSSARYHVDIDTSDSIARGYSAMSWGVHGLQPNATVIERIDRDAFLAIISRMLQKPVPESSMIAM